MIDISKLFDGYNRQARLYPALIALLPPLALAATWMPTLNDAGEVVIGLAVTCGLLFLIADFARSRGKALEHRLLQKWSGWPTTAILRHRDKTLSPIVKERYSRYLSKQWQIGPLPSAQDEQNDPAHADERYAAAVSWLKEQCRGDAFPLVEKENCTYGFRRNLAGLKPYGIVLAAATALSPCLHMQNQGQGLLSAIGQSYLTLPAPALIVVELSLVAFLGWIFGVNQRWVRQAGQQYAVALLACCDRLAK